MALRDMAAADNPSLAGACLPPLWVILSMAPRGMVVASTPYSRHGCLPMRTLHCRATAPCSMVAASTPSPSRRGRLSVHAFHHRIRVRE
jgi:hypothetical protein